MNLLNVKNTSLDKNTLQKGPSMQEEADKSSLNSDKEEQTLNTDYENNTLST